MRCSMTGKPLRDRTEGIWDDGEWISWDWINGQLADQELQAEYQRASVPVQSYLDICLPRTRHRNRNRAEKPQRKISKSIASIQLDRCAEEQIRRELSEFPGECGKSADADG